MILLPGVLAEEAGGERRFEVEARSVEEALRTLPVADRLFDERGELRPLVNVYVDGEDVREHGGVGMELSGGETVRLVGAIAGG